LKTPFGAKLTSHLLVANNDLHGTRTVAEIDKCNSTMIAAASNPTSKGYYLTCM
jgi:hypothetical protein